MMGEMMQQCCDEHGKPDFDKMKQYMESCGAMDFSDEQMAMMKEICSGEGMADMGKIQELMNMCGCRSPGG